MHQLFKVSTKTKMKMAKALSMVIKSALWPTNKDVQHLRVKRKGVEWCLDLNEGIDLSIYLFGEFESSSAQCLRENVKPGMTVLDVGANVGAHTLLLSQLVGPNGKVKAFEPTQWAFEKLQKNVELNPSFNQNIETYQIGFVSQAGQELPSQIVSSWNLSSDNNFEGELSGQMKSTSQAQFVSLDQFAQTDQLQELDFIKIDIDGFEVGFFEGAQKTLEKFKPQILMELAPYALKLQNVDFKDLYQVIDNLGYQFFSETSGEKLPRDIESLLSLIPENGGINVRAAIL